MLQTNYTLYDKDGNPMAGDTILSKEIKARADEIGGYVKQDATEQVVYPQED